MRDRPKAVPMPRARDAEDPDDPESGPDESPQSRSARSRRRSVPRHASSRPVRRWDSDSEGPDDAGELETEEGAEEGPRRRRWLRREDHPVYWRARDSLYFEPLVAVAIIVLLIVGLFAYTQNWPPVYVVESDSMQHGDTDILGLINTGDLVLAQKIPWTQITPYVDGITSGYSTYGEFGDVVLYYANGQGGTPIIHRAILYLQWNPSVQGYNATELAGLPCGDEKGAVFNVTDPGSTTPGPCSTPSDLENLKGTLTLYDIGWRQATFSLDLGSGVLGSHSGFVTMGDNNYNEGCTPGRTCVGEPDQNIGRSTLVEPGWIIGVARGMLPWFGSLKLLLEGNAGMVPPQSWQFLGLTVVGLILLAFGIHYALRAEGIEDPRRRAEDDEEDEDDRPPGRARRFLQGIRPWHREDDDEPDEPPRRPVSRPAHRSSAPSRRGRPAPRVRRPKKAKPRDADRDPDD